MLRNRKLAEEKRQARIREQALASSQDATVETNPEETQNSQILTTSGENDSMDE
jgi:hypothetical protein